ncbi:uncharacterized protein N7484_005959 [Penicillium longicatenatum]|uniref:uncharacterized protein n=1 Tax=Penicillium longicatenatum TaxID=1561947 RepID=UPI0025468E40|nr:uncharacterized protein N7484_005959 [Penicillium longicatenatum]KAJ5643452.1 hypothetical protein N7484_005959 [Penicillium longicatenatum]
MSSQFNSSDFSTNGATNTVKTVAMAFPLSEPFFVLPQSPHVTDEDFENFMNTETPHSEITNADMMRNDPPYARDDLQPLSDEYMTSDFDLEFNFLKSFSDTSDIIQPEPYIQPTTFSSVDEAHEAVRRRGSTVEDPTFPTTTEDKCNLVAVLKVAMKSIAYAKDGEKTIKPFAEGRYKDLAVEVACWELLSTMMTRHMNGASFTEAHEKKKTGSFRAHFNEVIHGLQVSKSICKHLLDTVYAKVFVDDPLHAVKRVSANKKVNDNKKDLLEKGKEAAAGAAKAPRAPGTPESKRMKKMPLTPPSTEGQKRRSRG